MEADGVAGPMEEKQEGNPVKFIRLPYEPLESQWRFHQSKARIKGFSGPIGSGKSAALVHEALRCAATNRGSTGLLGAPTYAMLRDATMPHLFARLADGKLEHEYNKTEGTILLKDFGSTIVLRSLDDAEKLRGTNLAWFGLDELTYTSEEAWVRLEGRLRDPKAERLCGFAVWTPRGYDWVWRRFIGNPIGGYEAIQAAPFENKFILEATPDYYERLKESYDPEFYAQEVLGEYLAPKGGLVYRQFDRQRNVAELQYDIGSPVLWALDFNVDPMSSVVVQMVDGVVRVIDEIVIRRAGTREACEEFLKRYPRFPRGLKVYADAAAHHEKTSGWSDQEVLKDCFAELGISGVRYAIPKTNPPVRRRVELMNGKLFNAAGVVTMLVDPRCVELIRDFETVAWVEGTHEIDKKADGLRSHLSDALGYLVWEEFHRSVKTVGYRAKRLI